MTPKDSISKYNHILRFQGARLLRDTSQPSAILLPGNYNLRFLKWGLTTALTLQTCDTMPRECGSHVQPMEPRPESSPSDFETEALTCQWEDSGSGSGQPGWTRDAAVPSAAATTSACLRLPCFRVRPGRPCLFCQNRKQLLGAGPHSVPTAPGSGGRLPSCLKEKARL